MSYVLVEFPQRVHSVPGTVRPPCGIGGGGGTLIPFAFMSDHWQWAQRCSLRFDTVFGFVFVFLAAGGSAETAVGMARARPSRPKQIRERQRIGNSFPKGRPSPGRGPRRGMSAGRRSVQFATGANLRPHHSAPLRGRISSAGHPPAVKSAGTKKTSARRTARHYRAIPQDRLHPITGLRKTRKPLTSSAGGGLPRRLVRTSPVPDQVE